MPEKKLCALRALARLPERAAGEPRGPARPPRAAPGSARPEPSPRAGRRGGPSPRRLGSRRATLLPAAPERPYGLLPPSCGARAPYGPSHGAPWRWASPRRSCGTACACRCRSSRRSPTRPPPPWRSPLPRTRLRDAGIYGLQMWAYFAHYDMPDDDPIALLRRTRVDYPIAIDRVLGGGETPTLRLQRALGTPGVVRPHDLALSLGALELVPRSRTARWPRCCGDTRSASRARPASWPGTFDAGLVVYWALPTAPPWYAAQKGAWSPVRRIMVESGERFWKRLWRPLYDGLEGNPFAAMPSLHFGTSVMAARVLSEVGRGTGRSAGPTRSRSASASCTWASTTWSTWSRGLPWPRGSGAPSPTRGRCWPPWRGRCSGSSRGRPDGPGGAAARAPGARRPSEPEPADAALELENEKLADEEEDLRVSGMLSDRRQLVTLAVVFLAGVVGIYFLAPKVLGLDDEIKRIGDADLVWVVVAIAFNIAAFASYMALFRGVLGGHRGQRGQAAAGPGGLVPDHHGRAGGHADLLGRRRGRDRAHLLGAAQGGHAAAALGLPDGGLPGAHLLGVPVRAGPLRRAAAHRRAAGRQPGRRHDRARGDRASARS